MKLRVRVGLLEDESGMWIQREAVGWSGMPMAAHPFPEKGTAVETWRAGWCTKPVQTALRAGSGWEVNLYLRKEMASRLRIAAAAQQTAQDGTVARRGN
jgi:hypothetical protein